MSKSVFSGMNRPFAGARTKKELPVGDAPLQLYSLATPNGLKVTIALEEMGLAYDAHTIKIMELDQFTTGFVEINPNSKIPALVDKEGPENKPVNVFESCSILLYLATKTGKFIPQPGTADYVQCINWLFFQHGSLGPFFGQFGHFYKYAPEKIPYAIDRYTMEAKRLLDVVEKQLEGKQFIIGDQYTIADMAIYPWIRCLTVGYNGREQIYNNYGLITPYANVEAWSKRIEERDGFKRGMKVNGFDTPSCFGSDKGETITREDEKLLQEWLANNAK